VYKRIKSAKQERKVRLGFVRERRKRYDRTCVEDEEEEEEERICLY
jgi:hypothetical protein